MPEIIKNPYFTEQTAWYPQWSKEENEWFLNNYEWDEEEEDWVLTLNQPTNQD